MIDTVALAWRFARTSSHAFLGRIIAVSTLAFLAGWVLMAAAAIAASLVHIDEVSQARSWGFTDERSGAVALVRDDVRELFGQQIQVDVIAPLGSDGVSYPGLTSLPEEGQFALSPALAHLAREENASGVLPGDQIIGDEGLATAGELIAVQVVPPAQLAGPDEVPIREFGSGPFPRRPATLPDLPLYAPLTGLLLLAVLPALIVLIAAAKLASAVREQRTSLLARLGAGSRARHIAAWETLLYAAPGLIAAVLTWLVVWHDRRAVTSLGIDVLPLAWEFSWAHLAAVALAVAALSLSAAGMGGVRRRSGDLMDTERVSSARGLVLTFGILTVILLPWLDSNVAADAFLISLVLCSIGVVLTLPLLFHGVGEWLREAKSGVGRYLVGSKFHRFPKTSARGWAALAMATALCAPIAGWLNINAIGDTDLAAAPTTSIQAFHVDNTRPAEMATVLSRAGEPGVVGVQSDEHAVPRVAGTCDEAAAKVGLTGCADLQESWSAIQGGHGKPLRFSPGDMTADAGSALVVVGQDADTAGVLTEIVRARPTARVTELTPPALRPSVIVHWILFGSGAASLLVLIGVAVLVTDRSMTARQENTLGRIGLSLERRRRLDALAFALSFALSCSGGMVVGLLLALVMARSDVFLYVPWTGLALLGLSLLVLGALGTLVVWLGSNTAVSSGLRPQPGRRGPRP